MQKRIPRSRLNPGLFSSKRDDWRTPQALFDALNQELGPFTLDAAASSENAKVPRYYTRQDDSIKQLWTGRVFLNPPYGRAMPPFLEKAVHAVQSGEAERIVCLIPCRTDTRAWHNLILPHATEIRFIQGRLHYDNGPNPAPFPSAIVVYDRRRGLRVSSCDRVGRGLSLFCGCHTSPFPL